jgi:MSHA biogenesis protein MshN
LQLLNTGKNHAVIASLQKSLNMKPALHPARELLANIYLQSGRDTEAYMLLEQGIRLDQNHLPFVHIYAQALVARGRLLEAKRVLTAAEMPATANPEFYALSAAVHQRLGEHQQSVDYYMHALELQPKAGPWWLGLAISLEALDKASAAVGAYTEAKLSGSLSADLISYIDSRLAALE